MLKHPTTLQEVVRDGLCTGCGICASLVGDGRITLDLSARGDARPRFNGDLGAAEQRRLVSICPGASIAGPAPDDQALRTRDPIWGPILDLKRAWGADPEIRHHAAAGGTLTALSVFLLESGRVDAVLHVRASPSRPMLTDAQISRTREQVLKGAQSRYGPASPLVHVRALLDAGLRFAVVAKPCDIAAIKNLRNCEKRAVTQVPYLLTIFCGGAPSATTPERIAAFHGVARDEVSVFRFRGNGWPGSTHLETRGGAAFDISYRESWLEKGKPWHYDVQWRCKVCPDAVGETADLSCPDGWILDDAGRPMHEEAPGVNAIVVRTPVGQELVREAVASGYLITAPLDRREFELMHHDHRRRKLGEPARLAALVATGKAQPSARGYRFLRTALRASPRLLLEQFLGTVRRVHEGQACEPVLGRSAGSGHG